MTSATPTAGQPRDALKALQQAGARGRLHAVDINTGQQLGFRAHDPVVIASVAKVPIMVALWRAADAGDLDLRQPVRLLPERRTPGHARTRPVEHSNRQLDAGSAAGDENRRSRR